jgi:hypothetical protein
VTATYYYTRKGSDEKIPAPSQLMAETRAEINGGEVFVNPLTEPILFSSEESMASRLDILTHLALVPQDVPDVVDAGESLKKVYDRHFPATPDGGLQIEALSADEDRQVEKIRVALAGETGVFDPTRLIGIVTFLASHPELFSAIWKLFKR